MARIIKVLFHYKNFLQKSDKSDPGKVVLTVQFINDGATSLAENETFPLSVDVDPVILPQRDTLPFLPHPPCSDEIIQIKVNIPASFC